MNKKELQTLRRPFVKEMFRNNRFNLTMTVLAALLAAAATAHTTLVCFCSLPEAGFCSLDWHG